MFLVIVRAEGGYYKPNFQWKVLQPELLGRKRAVNLMWTKKITEMYKKCCEMLWNSAS